MSRGLSILDIKTGAIPKHTKYQLAGYEILVKHNRRLDWPKIELQLDEENHIYTLKNRVIPSVGEILRSVGLCSDMGFATEDDRNFGRMVHLAIHYRIKGTLDMDTLDEMIKPYVESFDRFVSLSGFVSRFSELRLCHEPFWFAGTVDIIGGFPKDVTTAFKRYGLRLNKDGSPGNLELFDRDKDIAIFADALKVHHAKLGDKIGKTLGVNYDDDIVAGSATGSTTGSEKRESFIPGDGAGIRGQDRG